MRSRAVGARRQRADPRLFAEVGFPPGGPAWVEAVRGQVTEVLSGIHRFDPTDRDAVYVWDTGENLKMMEYIFLGFNLFLGVVGSFTLVVGGIGVANIMYIVVRERTREIGLKRALGARKVDILAQIFFETTLIVGLGAFLGLVISAAMVKIASMSPTVSSTSRARTTRRSKTRCATATTLPVRWA